MWWIKRKSSVFVRHITGMFVDWFFRHPCTKDGINIFQLMAATNFCTLIIYILHSIWIAIGKVTYSLFIRFKKRPSSYIRIWQNIFEKTTRNVNWRIHNIYSYIRILWRWKYFIIQTIHTILIIYIYISFTTYIFVLLFLWIFNYLFKAVYLLLSRKQRVEYS